jgi:hypothetical protein
MSWSVSGAGKPIALKRELNRQFEAAKAGTLSVPHEHASVCLNQEIVEGQLNFTEEKNPETIMVVTASGSAYFGFTSDGKPYGGTNTALEVKPLGMQLFLE